MTDQHPYAKVDAEYREKKAAIRADEDLTWEAKERRVKELGQRYDAKRAEIERRVEEERAARESRAYGRLYGPQRSGKTAEEDAARELRLARLERELVPAYEANRRDPLVDFKRAARAGNADEMHVIAAHGERFLPNLSRRQELRRLVAENEPESVKRARRELAEAESQKWTNDLAGSLHRRARNAERLRRGA